MADAAGRAPLVDLILEDRRWSDAGLESVAESAARAALIEVGRDPDRHEVSLLACDDTRIAALNEAFRDAGRATNVLSWPAFDDEVPLPEAGEPLFLGDIALAFETCKREADAAGVPLPAHAAHLVIHGLLHLLGHDHVEDTEAEAMEAIETKTLASLGIDDPYSPQERP
jgi:probable rRNA maturation factor